MAPLVLKLASLVEGLRCSSRVPIVWQATDHEEVAEHSFSDIK